MMKFIFFVMMFFFIMLYFNKFILQSLYQNLMLYMYINFMINFPLNNFNVWLKIYYMIGIDFYSFSLVILTMWILIMMVMISGDNLNNLNYLYYIYLINMMLILLMMCFMVMNLIMFYMLFESSLLPVFMLILGWGYQIDRIQAGFYMMLYTLFGSLPLLIMIIYIYNMEDTLMMNFINMKILNFIIYMMLIMAFLIKMPLYLVHLWLPKAHVEAPLTGSMILAGVMLKLGSYGLYRFMLGMMNMCLKFNKFLIIISLMGGIYSSFICLNQIDMKILVAYSSIVHMSILMAGLLTLMNWGIWGSLIMMIAHGLCSSGLFCLVNILYTRFKSRSLLIIKGVINLYPSLSLMSFLLCSSNLSFPPSLNLFSEIFLLNSLISWSLNLIIILIILMFFSALYSLYLYSYSQHGEIYKSIMEIKNILIMEYMLLIMHWLPLNLMFLVMYLFF